MLDLSQNDYRLLAVLKVEPAYILAEVYNNVESKFPDFAIMVGGMLNS